MSIEVSAASESIEDVQARGREHAVVAFALQSLVPQGARFEAPATLLPALEKKLGELSRDADLLAAVFGLSELASFLKNDNDSPHAATAIYGALSTTVEAVRDATEAFNVAPEVIENARDARFSAFLGQSSSTIEEKREPKAGEIRGGPLARFAAIPNDPPIDDDK